MTTAEKVQASSVTNDLSFLWLEITAKCNLFCSHCYAESGPQGELYGAMAYDDWTRVLDEAAELGCRSVMFIGGEPTMHPRLDDLIDHANLRGIGSIEVYTNATRLGTGLLGCFQRSGVRVATSFYSDDPAVHEGITQGKGSWQRTVSGIESVLAAGLSIRVGVIETERNRGHAPRAVAFLKTMGIEDIGIDRQRAVGRGELVPLGGEGERYEELCGRCWKGRLCVTPSGEVFPCVFSRATRLGDVKAGLRGILQTAKLTEFRRKVRTLDRPRAQCGPDDPCNPAICCGPADPCNPAICCGPDDPCNPAICCGPAG
jgi:MoaA/NifB/PqqE/SkfB family radical SAM enzyme